jgi:hypothetical protein
MISSGGDIIAEFAHRTMGLRPDAHNVMAIGPRISNDLIVIIFTCL